MYETGQISILPPFLYFQGGGFHQLGIQALALVSIIAWTVVVSFIFLKIIEMTLGLRVSLEEEIIGADIVEHGIGKLPDRSVRLGVSYLPIDYRACVRNNH